MNRGLKIGLITVGVLALVSVPVIFYGRDRGWFKKKTDTPPPTPEPDVKNTQTGGGAVTQTEYVNVPQRNDSFPLSKARKSLGEKVKKVQQIINYVFDPTTRIKEDGDLGLVSQAAMIQYLGKSEITEKDYVNLERLYGAVMTGRLPKYRQSGLSLTEYKKKIQTLAV